MKSYFTLKLHRVKASSVPFWQWGLCPCCHLVILPESLSRLCTDWVFRSLPVEFMWEAAAWAVGPKMILDSIVVWVFFLSGECFWEASSSWLWLCGWSVVCWWRMLALRGCAWSLSRLVRVWLGFWCKDVRSSVWFGSGSHDIFPSWVLVWFSSISGRTSETKGLGFTSAPTTPFVRDGRGNTVRLMVRKETFSDLWPKATTI